MVRERAGAGVAVAASWVGTDVAEPVREAGVGIAVAGEDSGVPKGVGVDVILVGDGLVELGPAVAATDVGVAGGVAVWTEQAVRATRITRSAPIGSPVIALPLTANPSHLMKWRFRNRTIDLNDLVGEFEPIGQHVNCGPAYERSTC